MIENKIKKILNKTIPSSKKIQSEKDYIESGLLDSFSILILISEIEKRGVAVFDSEGELTTPLVNNRECAFVVNENGISRCSIEKAYYDKKVDFKKPISCHLFPIRIKEYRDFDAVNYEEIKICKPACECGSKLEVPVYAFLKEPLIRKYGADWYKELLEAANLLK